MGKEEKQRRTERGGVSSEGTQQIPTILGKFWTPSICSYSLANILG